MNDRPHLYPGGPGDWADWFQSSLAWGRDWPARASGTMCPNIWFEVAR